MTDLLAVVAVIMKMRKMIIMTDLLAAVTVIMMMRKILNMITEKRQGAEILPSAIQNIQI